MMFKVRFWALVGMLFFATGLFPGQGLADKDLPRSCDGTLVGARWCDRRNGTVQDMTTGLVWTQRVDCWDRLRWYNTLAIPFKRLRHGTCGLADGSVWGDWRAPTLKELTALTSGPEAIRYRSPGPFAGLQSGYYWTVTTQADQRDFAWSLNMLSGAAVHMPKSMMCYLWAVRNAR